MKNGFRQQPQSSRKERLQGLEVELKNMQMAARISQMMTQQIMQNNQRMQQDLGSAMGLINELQYKILGVQRLTGLDNAQLAAIADELRLKDFNEASDKEDAKDGFTVGTTVDADSTVILTSKTEDIDKGIFRSKLKLSECGVPDLIKAFEGREVGAKAIVQLNGIEHEIELLAIRQPPKAEEVPQTADTASAPVEGNA
jgi:hypothetical protein